MLFKSLLAAAFTGLASAQLSLLYQFPNTSYVNIENVAIRSSTGSLLLNIATGPSLVELDLSDNAFGGRCALPMVPFLTENRSFSIFRLNFSLSSSSWCLLRSLSSLSESLVVVLDLLTDGLGVSSYKSS